MSFPASFRVSPAGPARRRTTVPWTVGVTILCGMLLFGSALPAAAEASGKRGEPAGEHGRSGAVTPLLAFLDELGELGVGRLDDGRWLARMIGRRDDGAAPPPEELDTDQVPDEKTPRSKQQEGQKGQGKQRKPCRAAGGGPIPDVVAAIFRCHLRRAGFSEQAVGQTVAEAVVVAHCESRFDPKIVVFGGRYVDRPHPRTGYRYTAAGVFQFIRATAERWIDGGYTHVRNPRANIDAAARLYLHNRASGLAGWEDWACAAANDGFKRGSVLPNWPGGPEAMPEWSWEF